MLDHPAKTSRLLVALEEAIPFNVELPQALVKYLRDKKSAAVEGTRHTVSGISYLGDDGGIMCHIVPAGTQEALVISLTQMQVRPPMPLAADIIDYQKHRIKKIKKQNRI